MRRVLLGVLLCAVMVGCSEPVESPSLTPPVDDAWIIPAQVNIANFFAGARAEYSLQVHNGNDEVERSQAWMVGTEPEETTVPFTLDWPLAAGDRTKVTVQSDNGDDNLTPLSYDDETREIVIEGFAPDQARTMTLSYPAWTEFAVYYRYPNRVAEGYSYPDDKTDDWVIIADATPVLAPKETRDILIAVELPEGTVTPDRWEFWIAVMEKGQGSVQTEMCSRWLVSMR